MPRRLGDSKFATIGGPQPNVLNYEEVEDYLSKGRSSKALKERSQAQRETMREGNKKNAETPWYKEKDTATPAKAAVESRINKMELKRRSVAKDDENKSALKDLEADEKDFTRAQKKAGIQSGVEVGKANRRYLADEIRKIR